MFIILPHNYDGNNSCQHKREKRPPHDARNIYSTKIHLSFVFFTIIAKHTTDTHMIRANKLRHIHTQMSFAIPLNINCAAMYASTLAAKSI